jgi:adenylate kinase
LDGDVATQDTPKESDLSAGLAGVALENAKKAREARDHLRKTIDDNKRLLAKALSKKLAVNTSTAKKAGLPKKIDYKIEHSSVFSKPSKFIPPSPG